MTRDTIDAEIDVQAPSDAVWDVISDLARMGEWSPQCRRMIVFGGPTRFGTRTLNINRSGFLWWPTRSRVIEFVPQRRIAFTVLENRTVWTYSLAPIDGGTRVTQTRTTPRGISKLSSFLVSRFLKGAEIFESELEAGMGQTLARIKAEVEKSEANAADTR